MSNLLIPGINIPKIVSPNKWSGGLRSTINSLGRDLTQTPMGGTVLSVGTDLLGNVLSGGNSTGIGNFMQGAGGIVGTVNPVAGAVVSGVGSLINGVFGSNINEDFVNQTRDRIDRQLAYTSNAQDFTGLMNDWNSFTDIDNVTKDQVGSDGLLSNKASRTTNALNKDIDNANFSAWNNISKLANDINTNSYLNNLAHFSAYGGPINMKYTGTMSPFGNQFKDGGEIYIKPENRGKFTALKERTGKSATWFKEHGTPAQKKMATFALNSRKWKHDDGGPLEKENSSNSNYKMEPIYIGGTTSETRKKYFNLDKELTQVVTNLATSYGISPALVIDRLAHEGIIDTLIRDHNINIKHGGGEGPSRAFSTDIFNSPYGLFGLDTIFDTYTKGITKTKRPINFRKFSTVNESGETVNSGFTNNVYDTLELFTAELASRRNQVKQQYPNLTDEELDSATATRYNATNRYFKQLMDSGEYKIKYPVDIEGINIPAPTKIDSKYIKDQSEELNLDRTFREMPYDEYIYDNKSWNPDLFLEDGKVINPNDKIVKGILEEYAKRNFSEPEQVKFTREHKYGGELNARKWKHAFGGDLLTHGAEWDNGVTVIGNGDTHENNPYEGVQMGVDNQGIPNLVEEGEVVFNDYVFSNRLMVPNAVREKYKLRGNKELTFADAAKKLQKESEERPNDPISTNGLNVFMNDLRNSQEEQRIKKEKRNNIYDIGGSLRYAPIAGAALSVVNDMTGGNNPDYTNADLFKNAIQASNRQVGYRPIGQYLRYEPLDTDYYASRLDSSTSSGRRAIQNTAGGNRAAALAGILGSDYNYITSLGQLARQAEEYNQAQKQRVAEFNRATDQYNSDLGTRVDMFNTENAIKQAQMYNSLATMRQSIYDRNRAERIANLTNFIQGLGDYGRESTDRNTLRWLADLGAIKYDTKGRYTGGKE